MIEHDIEIAKMFLQRTALIIDDGLNSQNGVDPERQISRIRRELEETGMNLVIFDQIPDKNIWDGFCNISFAILDWNLIDHKLKQMDTASATVSTLQSDTQDQLMIFIDYLIKHFLMPVFIFTRESTESVKQTLQQNDKIKDAFSRNQVKVYHKDYISKKRIENVLEIWCRENPAVYVMKKMEGSLESARISLFQEMLQHSNNWPSVVVTAIERDGITEIDQELTDFVMTSMLARTSTPHYETSILKQAKGKIEDEEIIRLYSNSKFTSYNEQPATIYTGDIYANAKGDVFWLNITPECDLGKGKLLFIKGRATDEYRFSDEYGLIQKTISHCIPMLLDHAMIEFAFVSYETRSNISTFDVIEFLSNSGKPIPYSRKGRLLHPYITEIQERFGQYISRHGNIRHPDTILEKHQRKVIKKESVLMDH